MDCSLRIQFIMARKAWRTWGCGHSGRSGRRIAHLFLDQQNRERWTTSEASPVGDFFLLISALLKSLPPPQTELLGEQMLKHIIPWEDIFHASLIEHCCSMSLLCAHTSGLRCCETFNLVRHREGEMTVWSEDLYLQMELSVWLESVHLPIRLTSQKACRAGHWEPGPRPQFLFRFQP